MQYTSDETTSPSAKSGYTYWMWRRFSCIGLAFLLSLPFIRESIARSEIRNAAVKQHSTQSEPPAVPRQELISSECPPGSLTPSRQDLDTSPQIERLFSDDQRERQMNPGQPKPHIAEHDALRRTRLRDLIENGGLHTGTDFLKAAIIMQHGLHPDDYLLAHTLAVIAAAQGTPGGTWASAASLDRYLQAIGQRQIYGTQYLLQAHKEWSQDPYDRTLISDPLRACLDVPALPEQKRRLAAYRNHLVR